MRHIQGPALEAGAWVESVRWLKTDGFWLSSSALSARVASVVNVLMRGWRGGWRWHSSRLDIPMVLAVVMVFHSPSDYFCNPLDYSFCCFSCVSPLLSLLRWVCAVVGVREIRASCRANSSWLHQERRIALAGRARTTSGTLICVCVPRSDDNEG